MVSPRLRFLVQVEDFLHLPTELAGFHVCVDKGTFDAISLSPDGAAEKRKQYVSALSRVLSAEGFFLITSCNWTPEELRGEFREGRCWLCRWDRCSLQGKADRPPGLQCCTLLSVGGRLFSSMTWSCFSLSVQRAER